MQYHITLLMIHLGGGEERVSFSDTSGRMKPGEGEGESENVTPDYLTDTMFEAPILYVKQSSKLPLVSSATLTETETKKTVDLLF